MALRALYRWHRRVGVLAAAALVYLLGTGVPLQFSGELGLGSRFVGSGLVLDWYGLEPPAVVLVSGGVANVGERVYLDGRSAGPVERFRGAVRLDGLVVVAGTDQTLVLDDTGVVLERLGHAATRVGRLDDRAVLETRDGLLVADALLLNWTPLTGAAQPVAWSEVRRADDAESRRYREQYRQHMLSIERLLQDLHSGRAFGPAGIVVIDAASLLLVFLAVSGLVMWWRTTAR